MFKRVMVSPTWGSHAIPSDSSDRLTWIPLWVWVSGSDLSCQNQKQAKLQPMSFSDVLIVFNCLLSFLSFLSGDHQVCSSVEEADSSSTAAAVGLRLYSCLETLAKYAEKNKAFWFWLLPNWKLVIWLFFSKKLNDLIQTFICWLCRIEAEDFTSAIPIVLKDGHRRTSVGLHWLHV